MAPVALFAVIMISGALALLAWAVLVGGDRSHARSVANLRRGLVRSVVTGPDELVAAGDPDTAMVALARRLTPAGALSRLERLYVRAGRPAQWPLERLLVGKLLLAAVVAVCGALYIGSAGGGLPVLLTIGGTVVCYFLPELVLHSRGQERSKAIQLELADTLDQMTIAVEAGLGFDSAMARAGKNGTGPLAEELVRTLQDIQVGQSRRQAYEALATRANVPDLRRFVRAVIQADAYGIAIADVLRTQADEMRLKRRQRAEEKAMQIPVKVIFPLMFCILPALFIVLLGPAVIGVLAVFGT